MKLHYLAKRDMPQVKNGYSAPAAKDERSVKIHSAQRRSNHWKT
jgi:hypothetical protein